jgi:hypothetical protein
MLLAQIPLSSSQRNISDEYKAKMYVRIAMLYLEAEDEVSADTFVGRSHPIVGKPDFNNLEVKATFVDAFIRFLHPCLCRARNVGLSSKPRTRKNPVNRANQFSLDPLTNSGFHTVRAGEVPASSMQGEDL